MSGFTKPKEVLDQIPFEENLVAAEFGSGTGRFSLELAERLPKGMVYAVDIQPQPLAVLDREAELKGLYNIRTIRSDLEKENGSTLQDSCLDLVLIPNVLFQSEKRSNILGEAARVLKPGGLLLVIEWREEAGFGPEQRFRVPQEEVRKRAEEKGFGFEKELEAGSFHWALLFKK